VKFIRKFLLRGIQKWGRLEKADFLWEN